MIKYNDEFSYEILDNGYQIYKNNILNIEQLDSYAKLYIPDGDYESNCLKHLEAITSNNPPVQVDKYEELEAKIDYIAIMSGIDV